MMFSSLTIGPRKTVLLAAVCTLPVFLILGATGHIGDLITDLHSAMLVLTQLLLIPRNLAFRIRGGRPILWAWVPTAIAIIDVPVSVYIAVTGFVVQIPWLNRYLAAAIILGCLSSLLLHRQADKRRT